MRPAVSILTSVLLSTFIGGTISVGNAQEEQPQQKQASSLEAIEKVDLNVKERVTQTQKEDGFFFFKEGQETSEAFDLGAFQKDKSGWSLKGNTSFTPRPGSFLNGFGESKSLNSLTSSGGFTPRNTDAELVLSYSLGDRDGDGKSKSLDIAISSQVRSQGSDGRTGYRGFNDGDAFLLPSYNVGFSVGYSGFNIGASVKQDTGSFLNSTKRFDLGFGYSGRAWSTSLMVGEYSQKNSYLYGAYGSSEVNFYALEFGASYRLGSVFRLSAGVRYFDFTERLGSDPFGLAVPNKQSFYLGTKINF